MAKKTKTVADRLLIYGKGEYVNKRFAPCIQCCGESGSAHCASFENCDWWREYTNRRRMGRKKRWETGKLY